MTNRWHEFSVDGHKLAALALNPGAIGQPAVLIHGIGSSAQFWDTAPWPYLLEAGPCYSLTLPGHYPAAFPPGFRKEQLTAEHLAQIMLEVVCELVQGQPVTLIGHSTGGFSALNITAHAATHAPGLVRRVVSISGFAHGRWTTLLGLLQRAAHSGPLGLAYFKSTYGFMRLHPAIYRWAIRFYLADPAAFYAYPHLDEAMQKTYPPLQKLDLDSLALYFNRMPDIDITPLLPAIHVPVLAITGDKDRVVPPAEAKKIAATVPGAQRVVISGAGHFPFLERSAVFDAALSSWLQNT